MLLTCGFFFLHRGEKRHSMHAAAAAVVTALTSWLKHFSGFLANFASPSHICLLAWQWVAASPKGGPHTACPGKENRMHQARLVLCLYKGLLLCPGCGPTFFSAHMGLTQGQNSEMSLLYPSQISQKGNFTWSHSTERTLAVDCHIALDTTSCMCSLPWNPLSHLSM